MDILYEITHLHAHVCKALLKAVINIYLGLGNLESLPFLKERGKSEQINCGSFYDNSNQWFTFQS